MTKISNKDIARSIHLGAKGLEKDALSLYSKNVAKFLARKRFLSKSDEILALVGQMINQAEGRVVAKLESANPLSSKIKKEIIKLLMERYSAKDVVLEEKENEKLLGGIKIEIGDEVIDLTLKNKINQLQEHLIKNA